ncbi:MAG: oligosaccharide flippase family protein [Syntrophobacteraceae bacterium]
MLPFWLAPRCLTGFLDRMNSSVLGKRLALGAFWTLVGTVLSRGLNMVSMIVVARTLGEEQFGQLGIVQSSVLMFQTLAGFGLGWAATKYVAQFHRCNPVRAGRIIALCNFAGVVTGGAFALLFYLLAPWLSTHALDAPQLARPLQICSLMLFVATIAGTQSGILSGFEAFRSIARIGAIGGLLGIPSIVLGTLYLGLDGAVWGMIVVQGVNCILNHRCMISRAHSAGVPISWSNCWEERGILWDFSLPAILGGSIYGFGSWLCSAMLVNRPGGFIEMGYFNAANQWFSVLLFLPGVLGQATIPVLSEMLGAEDREQATRVFRYSFKLNAAIILPVVVLGSLFSRTIMNLYGDGFGSGWATLVFTLFAAGIAAIQAPSAQIISAAGKMWMGTVMTLSWSVACIAVSVALIDLGSLGLAVARSVGYCFYATWSFWFAYSLIRVDRCEVVNK